MCVLQQSDLEPLLLQILVDNLHKGCRYNKLFMFTAISRFDTN